jgi:hypothetical protein
MVKELQVKVPEVSKWDNAEAFNQVLYEYAVEGVALPDDLREELRESSGLAWFYQNKAALGPAVVRAAMEWDAYHLWLGAHPEMEELTPGERLGQWSSH